jgi:mycoredoxin
MPDTIILYGKPTCAMVPTVRLVLERADADYEYINILADGQATARVREVNHGHEGVPTLEFPDGSTLTEPSTGDVKDKLRAMGYDIPTPSVAERLHALIAHPLVLYVALLVFVIGAFSGNRLLAIIGVVALSLILATNLLWTRVSTSRTLKR